MKIKFDYLVFIGRFQPFHAGHYHVVKEALKQSSNVILVIGSHDKARDSRDPFTTAERIAIIESCFTHHELQRIHFVPQYDHPYNEEKWIAGVQAGVNTVTLRNWSAGPLNVGIIGYNKDHSSYYIKKFPRWEVVEIDPYVVNGQPLNATDLRQEMFIPECVSIPNEYYASLYHRDMLEKYANACQYLIRAEMHHILDYKKSWAAAPYPPVFMTADAVVTQSGHVLLVRRGAQPGEGLWAMPGGFVNQHERVKDAAVRELCEETKIDIPKPVLYGSIVKHELYDDPYRSARGRTITQAYHFKLADQAKLPKVKGSDDAAKAKWFPLNEFVQMRSELFEDHYNIIEDLLGL